MGIFTTLYNALIDLLTGCVRTCVRHARLVLVSASILTVLLFWYTAAHIGINTDTNGMLDPNLPFQRASHEYSQAFPILADQIVMVIESTQAAAASDAADALAQRLRGHPQQVQSVYHPGGGSFFATHGLLYLNQDELWSLSDRLAEAQPFLGILAADPSLRGLFNAMDTGLKEGDSGSMHLLARMFDRISTAVNAELAGHGRPISWRDELFVRQKSKKDMHREFLLVHPVMDFTSIEPAGHTLELLHQEARTLAAQQPDVRVRITGEAAMNSEELVTVSRDAVLTMSLAFVLVCMLLIWGLRSAGGVVAVLFSLLLGLIWTAAFATFAIGALNIISVTFAVLFIGMGVDFGIQFALRYHEESDCGAARETALGAAARGVGGALVLAAAGAAISFLSFVPTSYRGLAELGIISSFSMLVALVTSFTLLPAFLSLLPIPRRRDLAVAVESDSGLVRRMRKPIIAVTGIMALIAIVLAPRARFDFNPLNLKDPTTEAVATFKDLAADPDTTPYTIEVVARDLGAATDLARRLELLPTVDKAVTLQSYVPEDQDEKLEIIDGIRLSMAGVLPATETSSPPSVAQQVAAIAGFEQTLADSMDKKKPEPAVTASMVRLQEALVAMQHAPGWPEKLIPALQKNLIGDMPDTLARLGQALQAEQVKLADLPQDLRARYITGDGRARIEVFPKYDLNDNHALAEFVRSVQTLAPSATDTPVELLEASHAVIHSCIEAAVLALMLTIIMHIIVLKSVLDAILISIPLVLAMLMTIGTSVIFGFPFNFANIIALPLLIGLNNAYGVYLVVRRQSTPDLARLLHSSTPRAVLLSGFASICSFGTLAIATHPGMGGMGILISLALGYALASSLIVLPAIMAMLDGRRPHT